MSESKYTDVDYIEVDSNVTYTAVQVAKLIQEDISTVRSWCSPNAFEKELGIKRINGRRIYSEKDVENLKFIKALREKNMPIKQIKSYISKHGFQYAEYNAGLINPEDPMGLDVLAEKILVKNTIQMEKFFKKLIEYNENFKNELIEEQKKVNEEFRDEMLEQHENLLKESKEDIKQHFSNELSNNINNNNLEIQKKLEVHDKELKDELNNFISDTIEQQTNKLSEEIKTSNKTMEELAKKRDLELIEELQNRMKINRELAIESEKESKEKKSFWNRLFNK